MVNALFPYHLSIMESTAREIMSSEILTVRPETTIEEALRMLVNNRVTGLPVVDGKGVMIGVVSEYDLLAQISETKSANPDVFKEQIRFTKEVQSIDESATFEEIAPIFVKAKIRRLPVVDSKGKLIGIITRRDMMRIYYYRAKLT